MVVVGDAAVSLYVTASNAACHSAVVAVPPLEVSESTPVPVLKLSAMLPIVPLLSVRPSTSCPETKLAIVTVAELCTVLLPSASVMPLSTTTGVLPLWGSASTKPLLPPPLASTGGLFMSV